MFEDAARTQTPEEHGARGQNDQKDDIVDERRAALGVQKHVWIAQGKPRDEHRATDAQRDEYGPEEAVPGHADPRESYVASSFRIPVST